MNFIYPSLRGPPSPRRRWTQGGREGRTKENRRRRRPSRAFKIGQAAVEGAISLHRTSLSSFPPLAKHTGLNTLTSEDLLHLKVAAFPQTGRAREHEGEGDHFNKFSPGNIIISSSLLPQLRFGHSTKQGHQFCYFIALCHWFFF